MPLPQKVLERLGQETPATPGWSAQLLMFSVAVFFIALVVYFGLIWGYEPYLASQNRKLQDQIQAFTEQIPGSEQDAITSFYAQLVNVRTLLDRHPSMTSFFSWLERNTQSNVYFSQLTLNMAGRQLTLTGSAKTLADAEEQIKIFETSPRVTSATIGGVALDDKGLWDFTAVLTFTPTFFTAALPPQ